MKNDMKIKHIHTGYRFTIYCDEQDNYFACGYNENGECALDIHDEKICKLTTINYFKHANIKIKNIFTNPRGSGIFWVSEDNKIYSNGSNYLFKLGLQKENANYYKPQLVKHISPKQNVISIQTAFGYSIILCHDTINVDLITKGWLRKNIIKRIPKELVILIRLYYGIISHLYATRKSGDGGNGLGPNMLPIWTKKIDGVYWNQIKTLSNKQIIKIKTGSAHSLFLDIFGRVYSCGWNRFGQLGLLHTRNETLPKLIEHFVENNIFITDIACGSRHCLAIDNKYNLYSWGNNIAKQCDPYSNDRFLATPTIVETFKGQMIKNIQCGAWHSCVETMDNKYYLFGSDQQNMCAMSDDDKNGVSCVNNKICKLLDNDKARIVGIYLGWNNTHMLVECFTVKQTKEQIEYKNDEIHQYKTETIMGYEANDQLLIFNNEEDVIEGLNKGVTLMGSVTDINEKVSFKKNDNSDECNEEDKLKGDATAGECMLGYTDLNV
eukprot:30418_1